MRLLLDTHAFLWWIFDDPRLSSTARTLIADPSAEILFSVVSAWEIAIKYASGRLPLPQRPELFVPYVRNASEIESLEIDEESAFLAGKLPRFHPDPFDRMLIAQAIVQGMTILTPDPEIGKYSVRVLW